jgi:glycine betaine catabolism A
VNPLKVHTAHRKGETDDRIGALVRGRRPGYSLARDFYKDSSVYSAEIDRIWRRGWLFAGHSCEITQPGEFFTLRLDDDSLIIVRDEDGSARALWNVCRHRGTELCDQPKGKVKSFVCPYHQWKYARDGQLLACRGMQPDIDKSQLSLWPAHVREIEGLIFVCFAENPPHFADAALEIGPYLKPQGLMDAKIAKIVDYEVEANWKLVWENNRECYHCNVNHPQYIKANFDHYNADDTSERIASRLADAVERHEAKLRESQLEVSHRNSGMTPFPDAERGRWFAANRTALVEGYVSETMDGKQVAPLMGEYKDADVGTMRVRTMPNMWNHSSCDHAVSTRLLPAGPDKTLVRVYWLVAKHAEEGRDYQLDQIMPFWQLTSEQDWELCERAQRGINSSRYTPGPLSTFKEYNVEAFFKWYLRQLAAA